MKGITLKAAFSLIFMFDLLFSSLLNFFHIVVFDTMYIQGCQKDLK